MKKARSTGIKVVCTACNGADMLRINAHFAIGKLRQQSHSDNFIAATRQIQQKEPKT